jgi:hypothetical protein
LGKLTLALRCRRAIRPRPGEVALTIVVRFSPLPGLFEPSE